MILAGTEQHLAGSDRFRLGLEAIHPGRSGILDAYATARNRPKATVAPGGGTVVRGTANDDPPAQSRSPIIESGRSVSMSRR